MLVAAMVVSAAIYWLEYPSTPAELYQKRCSSCHQLQDLSGYAQEELAPLVDFMRTHNGASRVISDREALIIIQFLERTWPTYSVQTAN
jgi:mono/diheme cytochrome c family protein